MGASRHLSQQDQDALTVELMTDAAYDTSQIEGEYLDRQSIQSSILRQLGLDVTEQKVQPAEAGIAEMTVSKIQENDAPLLAETLYSWHGLIACNRMDLEVIGSYRAHKEPMRIVSRSGRKLRVHFEAPPSERVPALSAFLDTPHI